MEYVYAAMLIHKAGGNINEQSIKKVLEAAGAKVDDAKVRALVAGLEGVNIDEAIQKAAVTAPAAQAVSASNGEKKKEEKKEEKKPAEEAAVGLGALFG